MSAGKDAEGVPGATTKKVVLVCPYASCLGFSGRSQRKPTLGDAGSVQASRGDVRSARSGEGGQGRMHGEAVTCHLSKEVFVGGITSGQDGGILSGQVFAFCDISKTVPDTAALQR